MEKKSENYALWYSLAKVDTYTHQPAFCQPFISQYHGKSYSLNASSLEQYKGVVNLNFIEDRNY